MRLYGLPILVFCMVLTGCMVGPDFHSPAAPKTLSYTESPEPVKTQGTPSAGKAGKVQRFIPGADIPGQWWALFHSPELNYLIQVALANNPNMTAAQAALRNAQETLNAQIGNSLFPAVSAQVTGERQLLNNNTFGINAPSSLFNLFNASVNVTYTLDVFGGARREIEALRAQVDYANYQLIATYLALTANIVTTSVTIASIEAQIKATNEIIRFEQNELTILRKQFRLGGRAGADVFTQEAQVGQLRATLPPLQQSLSVAKHALSVLVGQFPSEDNIPKFALEKINLPAHLPVTLPSQLVRQRPDIQASEALLHAACAQVGVATANLYPQITLNGSYGWEAMTPSELFRRRSLLWSYGAGLLQPIFQGGALHAKKRAAVAAYEQAAAQYEQVVLQAFQNVADTLRVLQHDAERLNALKRAEIAARKSLRMTRAQLRAGGANYLSLLTAEVQYQQAYLARVQAQAARYNDTAALFQALGGGWWNNPPPLKKGDRGGLV